MPLLLSLAFSLGILLIYLSATAGPSEPSDEQASSPVLALEQFIRQAGVEARPWEFLALSVATGAGTSVAAQLGLGWPMLSAVAFLLGLLLPAWYLRERRERRRWQVQSALADAVDSLRSAVRAGMSVEEGIASLSRSGPEVLRPTLSDLAGDLRLSSFEEAVRRAQERLADPVFDTVAAALVISHRLGGRNLSSVLDGLARSVRQAVQVEREVRAQQAKNVLSARIVAILPLALIVVIRSMNPDYLDVFSTPMGQAVLALCVLSVAVGYAAMLRTMRLPGHERVLR